MATEQTQKPANKLHPLAYIFVASGGGIVGADYAKWMDVDPVTGGFIGGVISLVILSFCKNVIDNRKEIEEKLMGIGAIAGMIFGAVAANSNAGESADWLIGGVVGGIAGALIGKALTALIIFGAVIILLFSQGPLGMATRAFILNANDKTPETSSNVERTNSVQKIEDLVEKVEKPSASKNVNDKFKSLYFRNDCHKPIKLAITYRDPSSNWRTDGWWEFSGKGESFLNTSEKKLLKMSYNELYYYAEIPNENYVWEGEDYNVEFGGKTLKMRKNTFGAVDPKNWTMC